MTRSWVLGTVLTMVLTATDAAAAFVQHSFQWSSDGKICAVVTEDKTLEIYRDDGTLVWNQMFNARIERIELTNDGKKIAYAIESKGVWISDLTTGSTTKTYPLEAMVFNTGLSWSPDNRTLMVSIISADPDGTSLNPNQRPRIFMIDSVTGVKKELKP